MSKKFNYIYLSLVLIWSLLFWYVSRHALWLAFAPESQIVGKQPFPLVGLASIVLVYGSIPLLIFGVVVAIKRKSVLTIILNLLLVAVVIFWIWFWLAVRGFH